MPPDLENEILIGLGKDLQELNRLVAAIDAKIEERDKSAKEWRIELCKKIDGIQKFYLARQLDKNKIWLAIVSTFLIPIVLYIMAWSRMERQVNLNTERLTLIEDQYRVWIK